MGAGQSSGDSGTKPSPLVEQVVQALEQAIAAGELAPGQRLSELGLAATFGVSRAPLREAFRTLEARRLVQRSAAGSVRVQSLSLEDLDQLLVVRETLEGMASRCAAQHMTAVEIAELRSCAIERKLALEGLGSVFRENSVDHDFHARIARGSRNVWLEAMLCKDLYGLLRIYRYSVGSMGERARAAFQEHTAVIDAIERRDGDAAETLMREHNRNGRINLINTLRSNGEGGMSFLRPIGSRQTG